MADAEGSKPGSVVSLADAAQRSRAWLFEAAAPLWSAKDMGGAILFPERLSVHGERVAAPHRLFVQARHIFSFCELGRLGWSGPWRDMVDRNVNFLLERGRRADGFFVHSFDEEGRRVLDGRADLYDQAFMLFAFAHAARALGRGDLIDAAESLDDRLQAQWRLAHGGYHEGEIASCPPYRQNPHMHLLECFVALHKFTGAPVWRERAEELAALCMRHFIDRGSGALREYFDVALQPMAGDEGRIVEPGHCFEWAWLFETLVQWGVPEAARISDGLTAFARKNGLDRARGVAVNEVYTDGAIRNPDARLWPQTERLKAALARCRRSLAVDERDEALAAYAGLSQYVGTPKRGVWRDKLRADGSWVDEPAPGSSFYHIVCALRELIDTAPIDRL